jgi:3D (Asp-Asp-Asp) domain-containing protein
VHPDWDPTAVLRHRVSADVALLKLAARLPPAYVPVALADPKVVTVGFQVTVAGYGQAIAGNLKTGAHYVQWIWW